MRKMGGVNNDLGFQVDMRGHIQERKEDC